LSFPITQLRSDEVHVWFGSLEAPPEKLTWLYSLLSVDEVGRANRFVFPRHRDAFIVACGTLRLLLSKYLNHSPEPIQFTYNEYGKPSISSGQNPGLKFNLSHSGSMAAYALTSGPNVGIDIEQCNASLATLDVAKQFFADGEVQHLSQCPSSSFCAEFFRIWTLKEAFVKGIGKGLSVDLRAFQVSSAAPQSANWLVKDDVSGSDRWMLQPLPVADGYMAGLAIENPSPTLTIRDWNGLLLT
jgi:4'-phosphopantetheinyl transferase